MVTCLVFNSEWEVPLKNACKYYFFHMPLLFCCMILFLTVLWLHQYWLCHHRGDLRKKINWPIGPVKFLNNWPLQNATGPRNIGPRSGPIWKQVQHSFIEYKNYMYMFKSLTINLIICGCH
jgi:hypothetical protein